ncbi:MAG: hypothetical protein A2173_08895 [Planctomycetes bacterium RBG_13_44_8b]|nr:MAG: hypothetical protein A2173_08895 [Planctomycetes bacterium RBG_13_44_8b]
MKKKKFYIVVGDKKIKYATMLIVHNKKSSKYLALVTYIYGKLEQKTGAIGHQLEPIPEGGSENIVRNVVLNSLRNIDPDARFDTYYLPNFYDAYEGIMKEYEKHERYEHDSSD